MICTVSIAGRELFTRMAWEDPGEQNYKKLKNLAVKRKMNGANNRTQLLSQFISRIMDVPDWDVAFVSK